MPTISHTLTQPITLQREGQQFLATLCFIHLSFTDLESQKDAFLHPEEKNRFNQMKHQRRQHSFLQGRYAGKMALIQQLEQYELNELLIHSGIFDQPITQYPGNEKIQVSLSHSFDWACAIAFPEAHPMAIDIEKVAQARVKVIATQLTPMELDRTELAHLSQEQQYTLLWTAKEALSKVIKSGMMTPFDIFEVSDIRVEDNLIISRFKNFSQYKAISFFFENYACTIISPKNTACEDEIRKLDLLK